MTFPPREQCYPVGLALLAAFLFGLNAPLSKLLLRDITPLYMVALLYLGAAFGVLAMSLCQRNKRVEAPLTKKETPWALLMIVLDILAPFLLMHGLRLTTAANASLLFNFEMVATTSIAAFAFREAVGQRVWWAIAIITLASILLSIDLSNQTTWQFSIGSLLVLLACTCWGLENNCTRKMSEKSPAQIVILKGLGSGGGAAAIAYLCNDPFPQHWEMIVAAMALGYAAYGMSIFLYVKAQRFLGASRTSAYYAVAPFAGGLVSFLFLHESPTWIFGIATCLMLLGVFLALFEKHAHTHQHEYLVHTHAHCHNDLHHTHHHDHPVTGWHSHEHTHLPCTHHHWHLPDIHHQHPHT